MTPRPRRLPAATLLAICERHGYRRDGAAELTRAYVVEVLQHETDDRGGLVIAPEARAPDPTRQRLERLRRYKVPEWLMESEAARDARAAEVTAHGGEGRSR